MMMKRYSTSTTPLNCKPDLNCMSHVKGLHLQYNYNPHLLHHPFIIKNHNKFHPHTTINHNSCLTKHHMLSIISQWTHLSTSWGLGIPHSIIYPTTGWSICQHRRTPKPATPLRTTTRAWAYWSMKYLILLMRKTTSLWLLMMIR